LPELTVLLDDPVDASHIVSFSGENARREQDNLYELSVERMLVKSRDRPKLDGVPVPARAGWSETLPPGRRPAFPARPPTAREGSTAALRLHGAPMTGKNRPPPSAGKAELCSRSQ
jgi:hypothetical protein